MRFTALGTGVACQIAARRHVAGIILQSPYSSLIEIAKQRMFWLRLYPVSFFSKQEPFNNAEILSRPHAPPLLIHGKKDRLIPIAHSEQIYRVAVPPKTFVQLPDAGHNDTYDVDLAQYKPQFNHSCASCKVAHWRNHRKLPQALKIQRFGNGIIPIFFRNASALSDRNLLLGSKLGILLGTVCSASVWNSDERKCPKYGAG
jgi:fermentation-respiration switch protein FrsA (DUF1100 family)